MQCPSCGFENMPGSQTCPACSADLTSRQAGHSVLPPRAKNRSFRQRVAWRLPARLRRLAENAQLRERMANARQVFAGALVIPHWVRPRNLGLVLLSVIPGVGQMLAGRPAEGRRMLRVTIVALAVAVLLYKTPIADLLIYGIVGLSMYSVYANLDRARQVVDPINQRPMRSLGVALLIIATYVGGYAFLRIAISPSLLVVRVTEAQLVRDIRRGDSLLVRRRQGLARGDVVVAEGRNSMLLGPVVGTPGDEIRVSDRVYVNGRPLASPEWSMPGLAGHKAEIRLRKGEYWVQPDVRWIDEIILEQADVFLETMVNAGIVDRHTVTGRVIAVTSPPWHRTIVRRVPIIQEPITEE